MAGVFGQEVVPLKIMNEMGVLSNVYRFVQKLRGLKGDQIHRLSHQELDMLEWLHAEGWL